MSDIILVTGAAGFIGSHLAEFLVRKGYRVRCLVKSGSDVDYLKALGVEIYYGDLLDKDSLFNAFCDVYMVYHLAAKVRPSRVFENIKSNDNIYTETNLIGTKNLVDVCLSAGIPRFVYFSSIAAVGPGVALSEASCARPMTKYGKSKLAAEEYVLKQFKDKGFPAVVLRPGLTYGPRGPSVLILAKLIQKCVLPVIGNGLYLIPFCYVDDLVRAAVRVGEEGKVGEVFFLVDRSYSINEFTDHISKALGKRPLVLFFPARFVYAYAFCLEHVERLLRVKFAPFKVDLSKEGIASLTDCTYCNDKVKACVGSFSLVSLEEGVRRTVRWYVEKGIL